MSNVNTGIDAVKLGKKTSYTADWAAKQKQQGKAWRKKYLHAYEAGKLPDNDPLFGTVNAVAQVRFTQQLHVGVNGLCALIVTLS